MKSVLISMGTHPHHKQQPKITTKSSKILGFSLHYLKVTYDLKLPSKIIDYLKDKTEIKILNLVLRRERSQKNIYSGPFFQEKHISFYTGNSTRPVMIEFSGKAFEYYGEKLIATIIKEFERKFGLEDPLVSRCDLALDVIGLKTNLKREEFYSALKSHQVYGEEGHALTGIIFGPRIASQIRIYNKSLELSKKGRSPSELYPELHNNDIFWRIEAELKRRWLKEHSINNPDDIFNTGPQIMKTVMTKLLYQKGRNGKAKKQWVSWRDQLSSAPPISRAKQNLKFNEHRNIQMIAGYMTTLASHTDLLSFEEICDYLKNSENFRYSWKKGIKNKINK